jgi:hypothetical protein
MELVIMNKFGILLALAAPIAALCLDTPCKAQTNLLKDSGFESGIGSWKISGGKFYAGLESIDCDGDGVKTKSLSVTPDAISNPFWLYQKVPLIKGRKYWFRASIRATGSLASKNFSEVVAYTGLSPTAIYRWVAAGRPHNGGKNHVFELSGPFTPPYNLGYFGFRFGTGTRASLGFKVHIDDIELFEMKTIPWIRCTTVRNLSPKTIGVLTYAKPGSFHLLFLGTKRFAKGLAIPGIGGLLEMDPTGGMLMIGSGVIQTNGTDQTTLPLPTSVYLTIKGKPLYWMPVQVTSLPTTVTLGKVARWGFL